MSQASAGHLLRLIRSGTATTRGELQRVTGLSRSTVGQRLDQLFAAGWIEESAGPAESSTGGRPAVRLRFDTSHAVVLAADLETRHARAAVLDLGGQVLAEQTGALLIDEGPEPVLDRLAEWFAELLTKAGTGTERLLGIGLSVPGPVDRATGRVVQPPIMPGWGDYPVAQRLRAAVGRAAGASEPSQPGAGPPPQPGPPVELSEPPVELSELPVLLENDANLMAYAEQHHGYPDCAAFLLVKVSTGIGAGLVVNGEIYRGIDGGAGDIGHVRLPDAAGERCMCGFTGCRATAASGRALARQLTAAGVPAASGSDVRGLLAVGQPDAVRLAREAGRRLGEVLATVVTVLNPGVLMLSGDLAGTPFLTGVRELLYQRAMPRTTAPLQVVTARLGDQSGLAGAAALVVETSYAPERANARLQSHRRRSPAAFGPR